MSAHQTKNPEAVASGPQFQKIPISAPSASAIEPDNSANHDDARDAVHRFLSRQSYRGRSRSQNGDVFCLIPPQKTTSFPSTSARAHPAELEYYSGYFGPERHASCRSEEIAREKTFPEIAA